MSTNQMLQRISCEEFRQELAGLSSAAESYSDRAGFKDASVRLGVILARQFGSQLKRETLWERIGSAFRSASAKAADGDTDYFVSLCLEHVKAEDGAVARDEILQALLIELSEKPDAWRRGLVRYLAQQTFVAVTFARQAWEKEKLDNKKVPNA